MTTPPIIAIVPDELAAIEDVRQVVYTSAAGVMAALQQPADRYILVVDAQLEADAGVVASAIAGAGAPVIEVKAGRWDGESHSPIAEVCRGTIAGFEVRQAVIAACRLL